MVGDYDEARYWINATVLLLNKSATNCIASRVGVILHSYVQWFFVSTQKTLFSLLSINKIAAAMGDVESAIYSMLFSLRFSFYAGENLPLLLNSFCELLRTMVSDLVDLASFYWIDSLHAILHFCAETRQGGGESCVDTRGHD